MSISYNPVTLEVSRRFDGLRSTVLFVLQMNLSANLWSVKQFNCKYLRQIHRENEEPSKKGDQKRRSQVPISNRSEINFRVLLLLFEERNIDPVD